MPLNSPSLAVPGGPPLIDWGMAFADHARWLRTVVRSRLGEDQAVDDVLQEVAVAAVSGANRPVEQVKVAPWLYRVAVRQSLMYRRTAGRRRKHATAAQREHGGNEAAPQGDPLLWLLGREREARVRAALQQLDEVDRQLLWLKYTEHWTYLQLATHLGVSENTIEHRLLTARQRLRNELTRLEVGGPS